MQKTSARGLQETSALTIIPIERERKDMTRTDANLAIFNDIALNCDDAVNGAEHVAAVREVIAWYAANPAEEAPCDDCADFLAWIDERADELASVWDLSPEADVDADHDVYGDAVLAELNAIADAVWGPVA